MSLIADHGAVNFGRPRRPGLQFESPRWSESIHFFKKRFFSLRLPPSSLSVVSRVDDGLWPAKKNGAHEQTRIASTLHPTWRSLCTPHMGERQVSAPARTIPRIATPTVARSPAPAARPAEPAAQAPPPAPPPAPPAVTTQHFQPKADSYVDQKWCPNSGRKIATHNVWTQ